MKQEILVPFQQVTKLPKPSILSISKIISISYDFVFLILVLINILGNDGQNYSSNFYRINDWYKAWLPDDAHIKQLHDTKTVYDVRIRYANNTNATYSFHGPRGKNAMSS